MKKKAFTPLVSALCALLLCLTACGAPSGSSVKRLDDAGRAATLLDDCLLFDLTLYSAELESNAGTLELYAEKSVNGSTVQSEAIAISGLGAASDNMLCLAYDFDPESGDITAFNLATAEAAHFFTLDGSYALSGKRFFCPLGTDAQSLDSGEPVPLAYLGFDADEVAQHSASILDDAGDFEELYTFYLKLSPQKG